MGEFQFISWGIHMAMLVFFSFGIGIILKEWKGTSAETLKTLSFGLLVLIGSFGLITYGSTLGQESSQSAGSH